MDGEESPGATQVNQEERSDWRDCVATLLSCRHGKHASLGGGQIRARCNKSEYEVPVKCFRVLVEGMRINVSG